jgi:hypothetical protein
VSFSRRLEGTTICGEEGITTRLVSLSSPIATGSSTSRRQWRRPNRRPAAISVPLHLEAICLIETDNNHPSHAYLVQCTG